MPTRDIMLVRGEAKTAGEFTGFYQALAGFAVVALVLLGVGGAIDKLSAPDARLEWWVCVCAGAGLFYLAMFGFRRIL